MSIEWDEPKRLSNLDKHGVDFGCFSQFRWDDALTREDTRGETVRLISLRKANKRERTLYEQELH